VNVTIAWAVGLNLMDAKFSNAAAHVDMMRF
jgi:hypothetical protein